MDSLVSIIIPTRNRVRQLDRALQSCVRQSHKKFEVLIIDDGSDSTDYIEAMRRQYPKCVSFFALKENKGGSHARNVGIDKATGEYVLFLDSDDELDPDALKNHLDCRVKHGGLSGSITYGQGQRVLIDGSGSRTIGEIYPARGINPNERVGEYLFSLEGKIFTPSMMVPRRVLQRLRFNEKLPRHQDYGFVLDASIRYSIPFHYIDQVVFRWISDSEDEGSRLKGVNLNVSRVFLSIYGTLITPHERVLYLRNIASSVAAARMDFFGFHRLCKEYGVGNDVMSVSLRIFLTALVKRVYAKLSMR
jgi:glycosyltransferase involved in cell wall biosynthesis